MFAASGSDTAIVDALQANTTIREQSHRYVCECCSRARVSKRGVVVEFAVAQRFRNIKTQEGAGTARAYRASSALGLPRGL